MILYYNTNDSINLQIENILEDLNNKITSKNSKLEILLTCLSQINNVIQEADDFNNPSELLGLLKELKTNIDNLRNNINFLKNLKDSLNSLSVKISKSSFDGNNSLDSEIDKYNKLAYSVKNDLDTNNYEKFILKYINYTKFAIKSSLLNTSLLNENLLQQNQNSLVESKEDQPPELNDNRTLLISQIQNKVVLPYLISELQDELAKSPNYSSLQEIIDAKYTIPIEQYKNSALSRFKEAYNLMRKKEHASISDSLNLALELTFNSLLNPAIITACKNLDELDIYLDCLNSNELDKFKIFEIKYEILPK